MRVKWKLIKSISTSLTPLYKKRFNTSYSYKEISHENPNQTLVSTIADGYGGRGFAVLQTIEGSGETIAYRHLKDSAENLAVLADEMSRQPWRLMNWSSMVYSAIRRILRCGRLDPIH